MTAMNRIVAGVLLIAIGVLLRISVKLLGALEPAASTRTAGQAVPTPRI